MWGKFDGFSMSVFAIHRGIAPLDVKGDVKLPIFDIKISIFPLYPLWSTTAKWNHDMLKECTSIEIFDFIFAGNREPDLFSAVI